MTRREELWREGSLSYAGAARTRVGDSQRYSRKSNEREPNEAILKGDIVGSLGRRTNSITSSGIERRERGAKRRGQERRERKRERVGQDEAVHTGEGEVHDALRAPVPRWTLLQERIGRNTRPAFLRIARLRFHWITLSISLRLSGCRVSSNRNPLRGNKFSWFRLL